MKRISLFAIFLSVLLFVGYDLQLKRYDKPEGLINGDVIHYYQILPAIFAEHDITFSFTDTKFNPETKYWPVELENGKKVSKVTFGMAYLYLPFFLPAHYIQVALGLPSHGFTRYDKLALMLASMFYTVLAFLMLRKLLLRKFSDAVVAITILVIALGTNFFYYETIDALMSHAFSFVAITAMIYFTDAFFAKPGNLPALKIGLIAGLIVLIRPTNIFVLIFPLLWGVATFTQLKERFVFWISSWKYLLFAILGFAILWIPQVIYWKYITGYYFFNGYGTGAKFFFNNPQIINSFFSYRKGWLLYTPVMSFAVLGFLFLRKFYKESFLAISIYFALSVYIISSWWLWWYGGGYGLRAYIDIYGALAFPLAASIAFMYERRYFLIKILTVFIFLVFILHNLFQVKQLENGAIHYSEMTKEAYWESFGHLNPSFRFSAFLVPLDYESASKGLYPKPVVKARNDEDWIHYYMERIRPDTNVMKSLGEMASERGISTEEMLYSNAKLCFDSDMEKRKKEKLFFIFGGDDTSK